VIIGLLLAAAGHAEVYKCMAEEGNVIYSQLPCANEKPDDTKPVNSSGTSTDDTSDDEPAEQEVDTDTEIPVATEEQPETVADCKKRHRAAIDEIDAELGRDFQPEQAEAYKQRLLELTPNLRKC